MEICKPALLPMLRMLNRHLTKRGLSKRAVERSHGEAKL